MKKIIEAEDLRVGDIVRTIFDNCVQKMYRVNTSDIGLLKDDGLYENSDFKVNFISDLQDISITHDLLVHIGFVSDGDLKYKNNEVSISVHNM